ncbi:partitioning defective 3 homolog isoform X3 [Lampetra fluviatilis]
MKVIVYFKGTSVLVPCGDGHILVKDLIRQAVTRYKKAFNKDASHPVLVQYLQHADGGILDSDDRLCDICDDKDKLIAVYEEPGMGASDESPAPQRRSFAEATSPLSPPSDAWAASAFHPYRADLGQGSVTASNLPSGAAARIHHSVDPHRPPGEPPTRCAPLFDGRATPPPPGAAPGTPSCDAREYEENGNNVVKSSLRKNDLGDWSSCLSDFCKVIHVPSEGGPLGIHIVHFGTKLRRSQQIFMQAMRVGVMVIHVVPAQQLESYQRALELIDPETDTPNGGLGSMSPTSRFSPMDSRFDFGVLGGGGGAKAGATETRGGGEPPGSPKGHASPGGIVSGLRKLSTPTALGCLSRKLSKKASIRLKKGPEGLGFTIATKEGPIGEHNPLYVKSVLPRGAAVADGRMKPGDQLLEVNGQEVAGKSQEEVVSLLRATRLGGAVTLSLRRQEDAFLPRPIQKAGGDGDEVEGPAADQGSATAPPPETPRRMFTYEIPLNDSGSAGLGISVKGSREDDTDLGIFVKSIIFGGAASKDGRLRVNDQLVAVNGQSLLGRTNSEAMEVLRRSMSTDGNVRGMIQIVVARRAVRFSQPIVPQGSSKAVSPGHVDQTHSDYNSLLYHTIGAHQSGLKNGILGGWGTLPRDRELADSPPPPLPPRRTPLLNHSSWTDGGSGPRGTQWPPAVTSVGWCHDSEDEPGWSSVQGHGRGLGDDGPADGIRHRKSRSMDIIADENDRGGRSSQQRAGWNTRSVGPSLGLVMSSSLESLQAAVAAASGANDGGGGGDRHHDGDFYYDDDDDDDDYDGGDGGDDMGGHGVFSPGRPRSGLGRGRACNASFRAAIDKSYEEGGGGGGGGAGTGASDAESWVTESRSAGSSRHGRGEGEVSDPDTLEEETVDSPRWRPPKALTNRLQSLSQPGSPRGRHNGRGTAGKEKKSKPEKERGKDRDKEKKEGIMKGLGVMFRFGKSKKEEKAVKVERKGSRRDDSILTDEEISIMRREQERIQAKHRELREQQARDRELKLQRERDSLGAASRRGPESRHRPSSPPESRGNAASIASEPLPSLPAAGGAAALLEVEDDDLDPAYARVSHFLVAEDRGATASERVASSAPAATAAPVAATQNALGVVADADIDALYAKVDKTRRLSAPRSGGGSGGTRPPSSSEERVAQLRHEFQKLRADEARTTDAGSADGMTGPVPGPTEHWSGRHSVSVEMQQQQQRRRQEEREGLLSPTRRRYNSLPRLAKKSPPRSQSGPPGSAGWASRGADDASAWNGHAGRPAHPSSCHSLEEEEGGAAVFEFPCPGRRAHSPLRRDVPPTFVGGGGGTLADAPDYAAEMQRLAGPAAARPNRV